MAVINIAVEGLAETAAGLGALPDQISRASRRAIATATKSAAREVRRALAASLGVPQRVLTARKRISLRPGRVWIGIVPIKAAYLGKPVKTKAGVKVGRYQYPDAFIARMPSGHVGVFRQLTESRLPIKEVVQPIEGAAALVESVRERTASRLPGLFMEELNRGR